jgi:hypothetical protein
MHKLPLPSDECSYNLDMHNHQRRSKQTIQQQTLLHMTTLRKRDQSHGICAFIGFANNNLMNNLIFFGRLAKTMRLITLPNITQQHIISKRDRVISQTSTLRDQKTSHQLQGCVGTLPDSADRPSDLTSHFSTNDSNTNDEQTLFLISFSSLDLAHK